MMKLPHSVLLGLAVLTLSGCFEEADSPKKWMEETKAGIKPMVTPIPEPKKFIPFGYIHKDEVDPFNPNKLLSAIARVRETTRTGPVIDENRVREVLESFSLDSLKMVGTLEKKGVFVALVQDDKNKIHMARAGGYIGQNHGKITKITETEINITEIVQDATGDNVEHEAKLELQESKQETKK